MGRFSARDLQRFRSITSERSNGQKRSFVSDHEWLTGIRDKASWLDIASFDRFHPSASVSAGCNMPSREARPLREEERERSECNYHVLSVSEVYLYTYLFYHPAFALLYDPIVIQYGIIHVIRGGVSWIKVHIERTINDTYRPSNERNYVLPRGIKSLACYSNEIGGCILLTYLLREK